MSANNCEYLSNEGEELQTLYRNLNSIFRKLQNTISNKNHENIISELETKTQELEILSAKLNWKELKQNSVEQPSKSSELKELEFETEDQKLIIRELQLENNALQTENISLNQELAEKERTIEYLNLLITTVGEDPVKVKGDKRISRQPNRSQTIDFDDVSKVKSKTSQPKWKKAPSAKNKSPDRHLSPSQLPILQDGLANPPPRPLSPRPVQRKSDCKNEENGKINGDDDICTKSLPSPL